MTTKEKKLSFFGDAEIKEKFVARMKAHAEADEIIQGVGWENGKGCFIGCSLHKYQHSAFKSETGLPEWLGHLGEGIFEDLKNEDAKKFAAEFYPSIPCGVDMEPVKKRFLSWLMIDDKYGLINITEDSGIKASVKIIGTLLQTESERPLTKAEVAEGDEAARDAWVARDAWAAWAARDARDARDAYVKASSEKLLEFLRDSKN